MARSAVGRDKGEQQQQSLVGRHNLATCCTTRSRRQPFAETAASNKCLCFRPPLRLSLVFPDRWHVQESTTPTSGWSVQSGGSGELRARSNRSPGWKANLLILERFPSACFDLIGRPESDRDAILIGRLKYRSHSRTDGRTDRQTDRRPVRHEFEPDRDN